MKVQMWIRNADLLVTSLALDELSFQVVVHKDDDIAKGTGELYGVAGTLDMKRLATSRAFDGLSPQVVGDKNRDMAMRANELCRRLRNLEEGRTVRTRYKHPRSPFIHLQVLAAGRALEVYGHHFGAAFTEQRVPKPAEICKHDNGGRIQLRFDLRGLNALRAGVRLRAKPSGGGVGLGKTCRIDQPMENVGRNAVESKVVGAARFELATSSSQS